MDAMHANPKLPSRGDARQLAVNAASERPLIAPGQLAAARNGPALLLPKWRAALSNVRAGNGNARVLCIGDSTTFGVFSNGTLSTGDLKVKSWPTLLAAMMNSAGINTHTQSFLGTGTGIAGVTQANDLNDARISMSGGWAHSAANNNCMGGETYVATTTGTLSFTPSVAVDTFVIWYPRIGGGGTISWNIDGGADTNISQSGGNLIIGLPVTAGSVGTHTLNLKWVNSTSLNPQLIGIDAYDSTKSWVNVTNAGWGGSKSTDWSNAGAFYYQCTNVAGTLQGVAPNLTIIDLGINDIGGSTQIGAYMAALQKIITQAVRSGDVILQTPNPVQVSGTYASKYPIGYQTNIVNAIYQLAALNNCLVNDNYNRQVSYTILNNNGLQGDQLHPNGSGYADKAASIFNLITKV